MDQKAESPAPPASGNGANQITERSIEDSRQPGARQAPGPGDKQAALYALADQNIPLRAIKVATVLIWHSNSKTGRCDPSIERLVRETRQSKESIYRALADLEAAGIIRRARHSGGAFTNAYRVRWEYLSGRYQAWLASNGLSTDPASSVDKTPDTPVRTDSPPPVRTDTNPCQN